MNIQCPVHSNCSIALHAVVTIMLDVHRSHQLDIRASLDDVGMRGDVHKPKSFQASRM